jgi:hypothetical protein
VAFARDLNTVYSFTHQHLQAMYMSFLSLKCTQKCFSSQCSFKARGGLASMAVSYPPCPRSSCCTCHSGWKCEHKLALGLAAVGSGKHGTHSFGSERVAPVRAGWSDCVGCSVSGWDVHGWERANITPEGCDTDSLSRNVTFIV